MSRIQVDHGKYRDDFEDYAYEARAREVAKYERALGSPPDPEALSKALEALLGAEGAALAAAVRGRDVDSIHDEYGALFRIPNDWSDFDRARATSKERMRLSEELDALVKYLDTQAGFPSDPGGDWDGLIEKRLGELKAQGERVERELSAAAARCEGFSSWPVVASPSYDQKEWEHVPGTYEVKVGRGSYGTPSFTLFLQDGKVEVDDVLEGGDTDFFDDPAAQADYFNLVNEIRKPGSSARGRTLKLYTARPVRDRDRYEGARELPANIFLANRLDEAEGLARELGGGEVRDVWAVRVNERHLVETLSSGSVRHYQTIRPTPVAAVELIVPGGRTARLKQAFRIKDERTSPGGEWWLWETGPGQLLVTSASPSVKKPGDFVARGEPARAELDLGSASEWTQSRYPGLGNLTQNNRSRDSYTIPHADSTLAGEPRRARQMFKDLVAAGVVGAEWKLTGTPHYRGMSVGEVIAENRADPVDQITHGTTGRVKFYHGTSKARWAELKVKGLRPGSPTGFKPEEYVDQVKGYSDRNVYLTTSIPVAEKYATRAALRDRSTAVVVEVTVEDLTRFLIDEDAAGLVYPKDLPAGLNLGLIGDWKYLQFGGGYAFQDDQGRWGMGDWRKTPAAPMLERLFQDKLIQGLRKEKTLAYRGAIPARNLKVIETYKPVKMKNDKKYDYEAITGEEYQRGMDAQRPGVRFDRDGIKLGGDRIPPVPVMSENKREAGVTGDFARWAVANLEPMTEQAIARFLADRLGMEIKPPRTGRPGFRFQPGDSVIVRARKHTDAATAEVYAAHNGKVGRVIGADPKGVQVRFNSGDEAYFPGAQKTRGVGLFRHTPPFMIEGSAPIEMVYLAGGDQVDPDQRVIVEQYLAGGRREVRSGNYYSGHVFNALLNAAGQVYFTVFSQQRVEVDPDSEAGYLPRSFNPIKGRLVYIGLLGKRPSGWAAEWAASQEGGERELRASLIRLAHSDPSLRASLLPLLRG